MTFKENILLMLIDKLVIGMIVLLAGYFISKHLENSRIKQALINDLSKQEVSAIAEVWSSMYEWESYLMEAFSVFTELANNKQNQSSKNSLLSKLEQLEKAAEQKRIFAHQTAEKQRFWIGQDKYEEFRTYNLDLQKLQQSFANQDWDKVVEIKKAIDQDKGELQKVFKAL